MTHPTPPNELVLLADHLDAILASGEDLRALSVDISAVAKQDGAVAPWERFADIVAKAKLYELSIVSRALQARNRAQELGSLLGREDEVFAPLLKLYASGVAALEDAVAELADRAASDFDTGLDPMAWLRTRGVIPADAGTLIGMRVLAIGETFMVARRIELGPLLDMTAALLDALDAAYGLFDDDARTTRTDPAREDLENMPSTSQVSGLARHSAET
jgi:hypothetical protein